MHSRSCSRVSALIPAPARRNFLNPILISCALVVLVISTRAGESQQAEEPSRESLQRHYDAARTFQVSGQQESAAIEYKTFLAYALREIAVANVNVGKLDDSDKLLAEAVTLAPENVDVNLAYAALRLQD